MNVCAHCGDLLPSTPHRSSRYWIFREYPHHQTPPHECLGWDVYGSVIHHTRRMLNEIELARFVYWLTQGWQVDDRRMVAHLPVDKLGPRHLRIIQAELDHRNVPYEITESGWPPDKRYEWSEMIGLGVT